MVRNFRDGTLVSFTPGEALEPHQASMSCKLGIKASGHSLRGRPHESRDGPRADAYRQAWRMLPDFREIRAVIAAATTAIRSARPARVLMLSP